MGRLSGNCFLNHSTVFTERCDWTNVGHPADLFKDILIDSNLPVTCWHLWSFIVVLTAPKTSNLDLIWFKAGLVYISPTKLDTGTHVFFLFWKKEGLIKIYNKPEINKSPILVKLLSRTLKCKEFSIDLLVNYDVKWELRNKLRDCDSMRLGTHGFILFY